MPRSTRALGAAALVLLVAIIVAALGRGGGSALVSPSPSTAATQASASPSNPASATTSASPTGVLSDAYGFLLLESPAKVRSETSAAILSSFPAGGRSFTFYSSIVSPDGRSVAYWDPVNAPKSTGAVLKVRPVTGGTPRAVLTTRPELSGNAFNWSTDGTGIVAAIDDDCFLPVSCVAAGKELWTIDVASGATEKIAEGKFWLPVAWDRAAKRVAAGVTGEGGYTTAYDLVDLSQKPYAVRSTTFNPAVIGRMRASSDGRSVLLTTFGQPDTLSWWPLAEPEKRRAIPYEGTAAAWRPGTSEIWWVEGLTPAGCRTVPCSGTQIVAYDVATAARRIAFRGLYGNELVGFRSDGSAAITRGRVPDRDPAEAIALVLVDVRSGATANVSVSGEFAGSVMLR